MILQLPERSSALALSAIEVDCVWRSNREASQSGDGRVFAHPSTSKTRQLVRDNVPAGYIIPRVTVLHKVLLEVERHGHDEILGDKSNG